MHARNIAVLIAALMALSDVGCAHPTPAPEPDPAVVQAHINIATAASEILRDHFFGCMNGYGRDHASVTASATEIAEAATAACGDLFSGLMQHEQEVTQLIAHQRPVSAYAQQQIDSIQRTTVASLATAFAERGKQFAMRAVIEGRSGLARPPNR